MRWTGALAVVLTATSVPASGCAASARPRFAETDRVARVIAEAIAAPRQDDAVG